MTKMKQKILVGCPTCDLYQYCIEEYLSAITSLTYKEYDILLVDNSKGNDYMSMLVKKGINVIKDGYKERAIDRIVSSRNLLRRYAIDNKYDYLLMIEQDVIPPADIIEMLLNHKHKIVSGIYFTQAIIEGKKEIVPLLYKEHDESGGKMRYFTDDEINSDKLEEARSSGLGCILIHIDILKKIEFRFEEGKPAFDDVWFANDVRELGYKIYADTGVKCKHLLINRPWSWSQLK